MESGKEKMETGDGKMETGEAKMETGGAKIETGRAKMETARANMETGGADSRPVAMIGRTALAVRPDPGPVTRDFIEPRHTARSQVNAGWG